MNSVEVLVQKPFFVATEGLEMRASPLVMCLALAVVPCAWAYSSERIDNSSYVGQLIVSFLF